LHVLQKKQPKRKKKRNRLSGIEKRPS